MVWGPPAQQSRLPEAYPKKRASSGGRGGAGRTTRFSDLRLAPGRGEPPGWVCARSRHPPILQFARSRPPKAPHGLLFARPRQGPVTRCDGEASIPLRSLTSMIQ